MNKLSVLETNIDVELELVKVEIQPAIISHRERVSNALKFGESLINKFMESGEMTPELDAKFKEYIIKINALSKDLKDKRAVFTKTLDLVKEQFTEVENLLDVKKPDTIIAQIQKIRNDYAETIALAEKNRLAEIARNEAKKQDEIRLRSEIEKQFYAYFNKYLTDKKLSLNAIFNQITLNTFQEKSKWFNTLTFAYDLKHFAAFRYSGACTLSDTEFYALFNDVLNPLFDKCNDAYKNEMNNLRLDLVGNLQSKKNELQSAFEFEQEQIKAKSEQARIEAEQKTASEARRKELEAEMKENKTKQREAKERQEFEEKARVQRESEEKARIESEQREKELNQSLEIEAKAETAKVLTMFDTELQTAGTPELPKIKEGWECSLTNSAGALELFIDWFNKEGKNWDIDKLSKKLDWLFTFANKQALKNESHTGNFKMVKFTPTYKADSRKEKTSDK